jgi:hypothetical protein
MFAVGKGQKQISADDTVTYTMNVGVASGSQAQTWSLPVAKYPDTSLSTNVTLASTPFANQFPLATHAQRFPAGDTSFTAMGYIYFRIANDSLLLIGTAVSIHTSELDTTLFDSASQFILKMPVSLGTVITSRESSYSGPGDYTITNSTETCDAFGSITLPNGTFQCLRTTSVDIDENHTGAFVSRDTSVNFSWLTKEGNIAHAGATNRFETSGTISVNGLSVTELVDVPLAVRDGQTTVPNTFGLSQNFPNPFNPSTTISYTIPTQSYVMLSVFNTLGQKVADLVNGEKGPGSYDVAFDAAALASGVYLYRIQAGSFVQTKKLVLMK